MTRNIETESNFVNRKIALRLKLNEVWDFWEDTEITIENIILFFPFLDIEVNHYLRDKTYTTTIFVKRKCRSFENTNLWDSFEAMLDFMIKHNLILKDLLDG